MHNALQAAFRSHLDAACARLQMLKLLSAPANAAISAALERQEFLAVLDQLLFNMVSGQSFC